MLSFLISLFFLTDFLTLKSYATSPSVISDGTSIEKSAESVEKNGFGAPCENLFTDIEALLQSPSFDSSIVRKNLFKIINDKRTEISRFVRKEKEVFRKQKEQELKDFDLETKKNKVAGSGKDQRRKERAQKSTQLQTDKKEFNKKLEDQEKQCQNYLSEQRVSYLAQLRNLESAKSKSSNSKKEIPGLEEFKDIPKGLGTVLKPQ